MNPHRLKGPVDEAPAAAGEAVQGRAGARGLRILFLAPQPFFEVRGTPLAVLAMVKALTRGGHRVDLLTYPQGESVEVLGLRHHRSLGLPVGRVRPGPSLAKLALDVPFMAEAAVLLASGRYDVVHAVEEAAHLLAPIAALFGVPLVADVDSSITDQLRTSGFARRGPLLWTASLLEGYALCRAAAVVTVCTSLTEAVRRRAPRARIFQIEDPPLIDGSTHASPADLDRLRKELGLSQDPVVVYSGNFEPYQGVDLLLAAAGLVPEAQFVFMGGEPAEIEGKKAAVRRSGGRCVFAGKRPPSELPEYLGLAGVVASPRVSGENTPFKVYTYLASGKPLLATRISTHTQLLDDSVALLVEASPEALAEGVRRILQDPAGASERSRRGQELIEERFSAARYDEKVQEAYSALARALRPLDP